MGILNKNWKVYTDPVFEKQNWAKNGDVVMHMPSRRLVEVVTARMLVVFLEKQADWKVGDLLTGVQMLVQPNTLGPPMNEMEVLAWVAKDE